MRRITARALGDTFKREDWLADAFYPFAVILMEAFALYPWMLWLGLLPAFDSAGPLVSMPSVTILLVVSLYITRFFIRLKWPVSGVRTAIIVSALAAIFVIIRVEYGNGYALFGDGWPGYALGMLAATFKKLQPLAAAIPICFFLWFRGIMLERKTSAFDSIYRSFVTGAIAFIVLIVLWQISYGVRKHQDQLSSVGLYAVGFFCFGLLSLAVRNLYLKRKRMIEQETRSSVWRSLAVIASVIGGIIIAGLIAAGILSPDFFDVVTKGFGVVWNLIVKGLYYVIVPFLYLASAIYHVMKWLISLLPKGEPVQMEGGAGGFGDEIESTVKGMPQIVTTILQVAAGVVLLTIAILILVKAIRRFGSRRDEEVEEIHESLLNLNALKADFEQFLKMLGRFFKKKPKPARVNYSDEMNGLDIREIYKRLLWEGDCAGVSRRMYETPEEYAVRLEEKLAGGQPQLKEITGLYSKVRYGGIEAPPWQASDANTMWPGLRECIRRIGQPVE